ncbi:LysR family transcriptional regulator [Leucobacter massiliensis]|uniref:LysR family transcriptional regulator n=1 Tax=Leucobacter massiliensis TaxID=1686285 RepID=UPI0011B2830E|nr:LysR family transcriptional regulator [Leucobacter massiliensis]
MLDLRRLALLREFAAQRSLAAVARIAGISTSAVSQQLRRLEAEAGVRLFEREGRRLVLTPAARRLVARAEEAQTVLERAEAELLASRARLQGRVRLASFSTFAHRHLAPLLGRLSRAHPDLAVSFAQIEPAEALDEIAGRRADIAVIDEFPQMPRAVDPRLSRVHLLRDRIVPSAPARVARFAALADTPWVLEPAGTESHSWALRVCREAGIEPRVQFETPDLRVHQELVRAGIAAALLPEMLLSADREPWPFGIPDWPDPGAPDGAAGGAPAGAQAPAPATLRRDVSAVMRRGTEHSHAARAVLDAIRELLSEAEAGPR